MTKKLDSLMLNNHLKKISGSKVTVVGMARSGVAVANLLTQCGAKVTISDIKDGPLLAGQISKLFPGITIEVGGHQLDTFVKSELIVISPGVCWEHPFLAEAREGGIPIYSEIEIASRFTSVPIIAITGTNGKTTTTTLVGKFLEASGKRVVLAGNIGFPLSSAVLHDEKLDYIVAEISSFQLEGIEAFKPCISSILNISDDHFDRHADLEDYFAQKRRIYQNQDEQDFLLINADDALLCSLPQVRKVRPATLFFSRSSSLTTGVHLEKGMVIFSCNSLKRTICCTKEIKLLGVHNLENVLAATAISLLAGAKPPAIKAVLEEFQGLPHRLELVRKKDGVTFINDSKGTNIGATVKSLESFPGPIILIAGGRDKGGNYGPLRKAMAGKVKKLILIGEARDIIKRSLNFAPYIMEAESLEEAVQSAVQTSSPGDTVLLSPACASFDMFTNYEERGEVFKKAVLAI